MIKRILQVMSLLLIFNFVNTNMTYSASSLEKDECWKNLNQRILHDIKVNFPELSILDQDKGRVTQYTMDDLHKVIIIEGRETSHLKSLLPLFTGSNQGERKLFIVSGEESIPPKYDNSFVGYLLYKELDGTNVMIKLRRSDTSWDVVSSRKVNGDRLFLSKECQCKLDE
ncbi:hypothetical protein JMM81_15775 [Bacillus sp. V3B]|uniref:hypothetical protein n=1 Tax=Bacillus sp. V3B TaxID=2804915 RepID=UPI00210D3607|nr:hypothetical protein [Bacillus sp. V3B]MCQ6276374.1 hypothetical protein [Bacillus sp. V3B]